jgi:hypothetical protein
MHTDLLRTYRPFLDSRPYTRWWWFNDDIKKEDIKTQLTWVRDQHFGGVEIAWMYPQPGAQEGSKWLSTGWSELVAFTKEQADRLGIGCDFTFGTQWPFGGRIVPPEDACQVFGGLSSQRLEKSWELGAPGEEYVLNHLDPGALKRYAGHMGGALAMALQGTTSGLFSDSWEVFPEDLWSAHLDPVFRERFGYNLEPYKANIDDHPQVRYDYRKLLADAALEGFFKPYSDICHQLGGVSRVQCHGAPTDLLAAFALVDVPESEALLFETFFSAIPGSAAALASLPVVTCETFTCIYGYEPWPANSPHHGQEKVEDMKLMADAVFAHGVNHIIWHGMPYKSPGMDNTFYATTHVGPDSGFIDELPAFNRYLASVSQFLKLGKTYTDVAVYLPLEDNRMLHRLPDDRQGPAATYYWELQTVDLPACIEGYHPLWMSTPFLKEATVENSLIKYGEATFSLLYVDVEWLDHEALLALIQLAIKGASICIIRHPKVPGHQPPADYKDHLTQLMNYPTVTSDLNAALRHPPLVDGEDIPEYWCREVDGDYHLFFAHPDTKRIRYPMAYEGWRSTVTLKREVTVNLKGRTHDLHLIFDPEDALFVKISTMGDLDITVARIEA